MTPARRGRTTPNALCCCSAAAHISNADKPLHWRPGSCTATTGIPPRYRLVQQEARPRTVFTIHNLAHAGF
jgi:hypothetical protein